MTGRLVCGGETFEVKMEVLTRLPLFQKTLELVREEYQVKTNVDAGLFREFLRGVEGEDIEINSENVLQLTDLCKEFGFPGLMARIEGYVRNQPEATASEANSDKDEAEVKGQGRCGILLSSEGMQQVLEHDDSKFTFVVGDRKYECSVSQACFLSPLVSRLLCSDNSVDSVFLEIDDSDGYFGEVLKLGRGDSLLLDDEHVELVHGIAVALDNDELSSWNNLQNVKLSSRGMRRVAETGEENFRFIIVEGREYDCSVFQACFLSPRVSSLLSMDRSTCCFNVYVDDPDDCFGDIMSVGSGRELIVTERNQAILKEIALQLDNQELLCCIDEAVDAPLPDIGSELSDIASHFYALDVERMK